VQALLVGEVRPALCLGGLLQLLDPCAQGMERGSLGGEGGCGASRKAGAH
jgi:hypothetical protein